MPLCVPVPLCVDVGAIRDCAVADFQDWLRAAGQSQPSLADFVVEDCPPENLPRDSSIADLVKGEVSPIAPHRIGRAG